MAGLVFKINLLFAQAVGIGTANPHPGTILEIISGTKGIALPRVQEANLPANPPVGTLVYKLTANIGALDRGFHYWDGGRWQGLCVGVNTNPFTIQTTSGNTLSLSNLFAPAKALAVESAGAGIEAITNSVTAYAVKGIANGGGENIGVEGNATFGTAIKGITERGWGLYGLSTGVGQYANNTFGVYGEARSVNGIGGFFMNTNNNGHALRTTTGMVQLGALANGFSTRVVSGNQVMAEPNGLLVPSIPQWNWIAGSPVENIGTSALRVGIGTFLPTSRLHIAHNSVFNGSSQLLLEETENDYARMTLRSTANNTRWDVAGLTSTTNANAQLNFFFSGLNADVLSLRGNGNAIFHGTVTANGVLLTSDVRLKKDIQPLGNPLQQLSQLSGYQYHWKGPGQSTQLQTGLLAQEVEQVFPHMVHTDENGHKAVSYNSLIPVLLEAVKQLQQQVNTLETQINNLQK